MFKRVHSSSSLPHEHTHPVAYRHARILGVAAWGGSLPQRLGYGWLSRSFAHAFDSKPRLVRLAGLEPARIAPTDFKSVAATDYATVAWCPRRDSNSHAFGTSS